MEYYMTLAACKLYKGEKECPYKRNDKRIVFWNYEKWACKADLKTTRAVLSNKLCHLVFVS